MNRPFTEKEMSLLNIWKNSPFTGSKRKATRIPLFTCHLAKISKLDHTLLSRICGNSCLYIAGEVLAQYGPFAWPEL